MAAAFHFWSGPHLDPVSNDGRDKYNTLKQGYINGCEMCCLPNQRVWQRIPVLGFVLLTCNGIISARPGKMHNCCLQLVRGERFWSDMDGGLLSNSASKI